MSFGGYRASVHDIACDCVGLTGTRGCHTSRMRTSRTAAAAPRPDGAARTSCLGMLTVAAIEQRCHRRGMQLIDRRQTAHSRTFTHRYESSKSTGCLSTH